MGWSMGVVVKRVVGARVVLNATGSMVELIVVVVMSTSLVGVAS